MTEDLNYICKIIRKLLNIVLVILAVFIGTKLVIFYIPFLIAFIISLIIEPAIKILMKKMNISRKMSSILIFIIVLSIIIGIISWGIISLIQESTNLLEMLNLYINKAYVQIQTNIGKIKIEKLNASEDIVNLIQKSLQEVLFKISNWTAEILTNFLNVITSIPTILIYTVITIMALYFICIDKIYILDFMEHHISQKWVKKLGRHIREIASSLGGYLKAEMILVLVSFVISVVGLYLFKIIGMNIKYPLIFALAIGFVDALPILGSGTVMVPWAIISALNGDIRLGVAIVVLWIIMSVVRQFLEPKIVSGKIGVHPIFTLISMYTGFKVIGVFGMLLGPIVLIILKNIFASELDKGICNSRFLS